MTKAYKQHRQHCSCEPLKNKYFADVERLEAVITRQQQSFDAALSWKKQAEAQRDEAVRLLKTLRSRPCPAQCSHTTCMYWQRELVKFLAGLTERGATDGPSCKRVSVCTSGHPDTGFEKCTYLSDAQSGLCHMPQQTPKCDRHGCPWLEEGECPWNTPPPGRPVASSGPRPVGGRE